MIGSEYFGNNISIQVRHRKFARGRLPDVIIIGAMKCATTSLHFYLNHHPQVCMSDPKELNFFFEPNFSRGLAWYASHFCGQAEIVGEASPNYAKKHLFRDVPKWMYDALPKAKLIYILRDPIERILSHYIFNCLRGIERQNFEDAVLQTQDNGYVQTSRYHMQLEEFLVHYPQNQVCVMTCEDLKADGLNVMNNIANFLGIDAFEFVANEELNRSVKQRQRNRLGCFLHQQSWTHRLRWGLPRPFVHFVRKITQYGTTVEKPVLSGEAKQRLTEWLYNDIKNLRRTTGLKFKKWCV